MPALLIEELYEYGLHLSASKSNILKTHEFYGKDVILAFVDMVEEMNTMLKMGEFYRCLGRRLSTQARTDLITNCDIASSRLGQYSVSVRSAC